MTQLPIDELVRLLLGVLLVAFAAYRVTRFLVGDKLIGSNYNSGSKWSRTLNGVPPTRDVHGTVVDPGRDGIAYTSGGEDRSWLRGKIGDLLTCAWCMGFWITGTLWCVWLLAWPWQLGIQGWIALWAAVGLQAILSNKFG